MSEDRLAKTAESRNTPFIAIQVGAVSFVDEGVAPLLDLLQEKARINALFLATHSFDPGTASRQIKGHPLPDHGGSRAQGRVARAMVGFTRILFANVQPFN